MLYIDKTVHILFVSAIKKVTWCHQVLSFYVLLFATTQVCPALFQKPQLLFLPSRLFPHVLQRLCVQDFCKKQALIHSIFPAVPFVSQRITRCPIVRKKCGGRVHKRLFFRLFLRNLEKGCCFRIWQSVHENFAEVPSWDGFWEKRHFELNWATTGAGVVRIP